MQFPATIDTAGWTEIERQQCRAEAVYAGFDVLEDRLDEVMIVTRPKPMVVHKPKRSFLR